VNDGLIFRASQAKIRGRRGNSEVRQANARVGIQLESAVGPETQYEVHLHNTRRPANIEDTLCDKATQGFRRDPIRTEPDFRVAVRGQRSRSGVLSDDLLLPCFEPLIAANDRFRVYRHLQPRNLRPLRRVRERSTKVLEKEKMFTLSHEPRFEDLDRNGRIFGRRNGVLDLAFTGHSRLGTSGWCLEFLRFRF
jgi:hypothetical protein